MHDQRAQKCHACKSLRLRTKEKQVIARDVAEILQMQDAAEHLEVLEEERQIFENIRDINASITAAERSGDGTLKADMQKELIEEKIS